MNSRIPLTLALTAILSFTAGAGHNEPVAKEQAKTHISEKKAYFDMDRFESSSFVYAPQFNNVEIKDADDSLLITGKAKAKWKGGKLVPPSGNWNLEPVHTLGVLVENLGKSPLIINMRLNGKDAEDWVNSSAGKGIVEPGEKLVVGVCLMREPAKSPVYGKLNGLPDGRKFHWLFVDSANIESLSFAIDSKTDVNFKLHKNFYIKRIYQETDEEASKRVPFIDQYGQYMHRDWRGKVKSQEDFAQNAVMENKLYANAPTEVELSTYGGWKDGPKLKSTGFFRVEKYQDKWWFVDPEGYLFWSHGACDVGIGGAPSPADWKNEKKYAALPDADGEFAPFYIWYKNGKHTTIFDYYKANLLRKYGTEWNKRALEKVFYRMDKIAINTAGGWPRKEILTHEKRCVYTPTVYVSPAHNLFDPFKASAAADIAETLQKQLERFAYDPWCLGVFVDNELPWPKAAKKIVAEGSAARAASIKWLKEKYNEIGELNKAWSSDYQNWVALETDEKLDKHMLAADSVVLTTKYAELYYRFVSEGFKKAAPNLLYLGSRINAAPNHVIKASAPYVDVLSTNLYKYVPSPHLGGYRGLDKPIIISEFHIANLNEGGLGPGLISAVDEVQQGRQYKAFVTDALHDKDIIGTHLFQWIDQSVNGRGDGENYHIGLFDITDRPHQTFVKHVMSVGRKMYEIRNSGNDPWNYTK